MKHPYRARRGKDFIVLPLIFIFLTLFVFYFAFAPVISPYMGLASLFFQSKESVETTDRFTGLGQQLATSGTLQLDEYPNEGDKIGQIDLKETGLSVPVYYGDNNAQLNKGVGIYPGGWIPGEEKTIMAAGHAGTFFKNLEGAKPGMRVKFSTYYGEYEYEITDIKILNETDTSAYDFSRTDENLIMYTCYPFDALGYTPNRFFVYAKYISGPTVQ